MIGVLRSCEETEKFEQRRFNPQKIQTKEQTHYIQIERKYTICDWH